MELWNAVAFCFLELYGSSVQCVKSFLILNHALQFEWQLTLRHMLKIYAKSKALTPKLLQSNPLNGSTSGLTKN